MNQVLKYILLFIIEVLFSIFAIFTFIKPIKFCIVILSISNLIIFITSLFTSKVKSSRFFSLFIFVYHLTIVLPLNLFVLARYIGYCSNNSELTCFLCVSLFFIIPIYYIETIINNSEEYNEELSFISIIFSIIKLILLFVTNISEYIGINIPYTKSIYLAILFSLAVQFVLKSIIKYFENINSKKAKIEKEKQIDEYYETIQFCFEEAKESEFAANAFLDYLSMYEGGLNLADIKNIDRKTYIYIKNSCEDLFKEHPYWTDDQITTTYLYVWSKNKKLPNIPIEDDDPHRFFGF